MVYSESRCAAWRTLDFMGAIQEKRGDLETMAALDNAEIHATRENFNWKIDARRQFFIQISSQNANLKGV